MIEVKVFRVKLNAGGYDRWGKYFGVLHHYPVFGADIDDGVYEKREYIRASSYQEAREHYKRLGMKVVR
jgi:hypothetical protein